LIFVVVYILGKTALIPNGLANALKCY